MSRQKLPKETRNKILQLVRDSVATQEHIKKLVEIVLTKLNTTIESGQAGPSVQLDILAGLTTCAQSMGKANEANLKSIVFLDSSEEDEDDDTKLQEKSGDQVLAEMAGITNKFKRGMPAVKGR